ncbi:hypothetical protein MMC34_000031 [Xylographa carneopallida]|nr:hypothetical protein [Xylographa carneopallida]
MFPTGLTFTGRAEEAAFTVVGPTKQQCHFRQKQAEASAWEGGSHKIEFERAQRWQEKESLAVAEERVTQAWKREQAARAAPLAEQARTDRYKGEVKRREVLAEKQAKRKAATEAIIAGAGQRKKGGRGIY